MQDTTKLIQNVNIELSKLKSEIGKNYENGFKLSEPIYLCTWNGHETIEIHTIKTLTDKYSDIKERYENNETNSYSDSTWKEIFKELKETWSCGLPKVHIEDNMEIQILIYH